MKRKNRRTAIAVFVVTFLALVAVLAASVIKTNAYNNTRHRADLSGQDLFSQEGAQTNGVTVSAAPRGSTSKKQEYTE